MALNLPGFPVGLHFTQAETGVPDLGAALTAGISNYYKPQQLAEELLKSKLQNEALKFKNTPDYQNALLDFLRGQGANMWGQLALRNAQTQDISQKGSVDQLKASLLKGLMNPPANKNQSIISNVMNPDEEGNRYLQGMPENGFPRNDDQLINNGSFKYVDFKPEEANKFIQPDLYDNQQKYRESIIQHGILGFPSPKVRTLPSGEIIADTAKYGPLVIGSGPAFNEAAKLKSQASQEGKQLAELESKQSDEQRQVQTTLGNINVLKSLMTNPDAKSVFGPGSKYTVDYNPFVPDRIKELRGKMAPFIQSFMSNAIQPLRGLGSMSNREFEQAMGSSLSMDLPYATNKGRLESLEMIVNQANNRLDLIDKLKSQGVNAQEAQKIAFKTYKMQPFLDTLNKIKNKQSQTIEIRNKKTGQKETVTLEEARKRGVRNV